MRTIPITAIPNQTLSVRLDDQRLVLRLKEANGVMVADLERDGVVVISGTRVLAGELIIPYEYLQDGNFLLLTLDDELPDWRQFGVTQQLVYLERGEALSIAPLAPVRRMTWGVRPILFGANTSAGRLLGDAPTGTAIDFRADEVVVRNANNRVVDNRKETAQDFTNTVRAGATATYIGADRLLKTAAANELRFDHDPLTGAALGALIEPAGTNIQLWSSDLSQTFYNKNGVTIGVTDGTPTRVIENTANAAHLVSNGGVTVVSGTRYCVSGEFKANGRSRFMFGGNGGNFPNQLVVDLVARTITGGGGTVANRLLTELNDGYFLASFSDVSPSSGPSGMIIALRDASGTAAYQGDGTSGIIARRLQFEAGSLPSSRISTTTAPVTRAADQVSFPLSPGVHNLTYVFDDGSTFLAPGVSGTAAIPTNLPRHHVGGIVALPV